MGTRRLIVGVVLLAALLVAGCGDNRSAATREMDTRFQKVDFEMANLETVNSEYNNRDFARETRRYIALVREYADQLGRAEARRRLLQKGDELSSYCLPCVATLESEATKY
jgi:outer membrane murein-binding lipoprotein Lpp